MVFKNFKLQVTIRVVILVMTIFILVWCLLNGYVLRSVYATFALVILVIEFIRYVDRFNRDVNTFMISLLQRDFTTRLHSPGSRTFNELYATLSSISNVFKTISAEKEAQFRFLEMLVEHLRVGILSMDESGKIQLANHAIKVLLQRDVLFSLRSLESIDPALVEALLNIKSGETLLFKLRMQNELLQLSIHASEFKLENINHKLISMQNIRNELDTREMEAWQKLIRVLTHEIMNSVSPIISLSGTMHSLLQQHREPITAIQPNVYNALDKGLDAVRVRSEGLYNFTQSYRKLTGIPRLSLENTNTREIISKVATLMENDMKQRGVAFKVDTPDIPIVADADLLQHVLINLLLNACEAVAGAKEPSIAVGAFLTSKGGVAIFVSDNGEGIDDAIADKVFVPFFTTRKNGSGIGLSLVKQILQLHHADIRFDTKKGKGTEFVITL